jgi:hypothetical protein
MKRMLGVVAALTVGGAALDGASAQDRMGFFRSPVFVLQPGLIRSFSEGDGFDFNARFVTAIPTSSPRLTLVGIVQWTPFQDEDGDGANENAPGFVYGPVVNVINTPNVSFDIDGLFAYTPTGSIPANSDYTHKFLIEGDLFIKLGSMMNTRGHWRNLSLYAMLAYVLTGLDDPPGGQIESKDRTVLLTGLSLPLAPWRQ